MWLVELQGEWIDLEEIPIWFPDGDVHGIEEGKTVYLTGARFDACTDASLVVEIAEQILEEYCAVIKILWPAFVRPQLGPVSRQEEDGRRTKHYFMNAAPGSYRIKARGTLTDANSEGKALGITRAQQLLHATKSAKRLGTAVMIWGTPNPTWSRLYRVLEEVEEYLGGNANKFGLCSAKLRERFTRSCNNASVAGIDSRHADGKFTPPEKPMTLDEATEFIRGILEGALSMDQSGGHPQANASSAAPV